MPKWKSLADGEQIVAGVGHLVQPGEVFDSNLDLSDRPDAFAPVSETAPASDKKAARPAGDGE